MEDIFVYSGVYGIMALALLNFVIIIIAYRKKHLTLGDSFWLSLLIIGISLLAAAVFFRNITKMNQWYYPLIFASLIGMVGLFLRLTRMLLRRR